MKIISSKLEGGLGNYLFQIAAGYSVALRDDRLYICFLHEVQKGHTHISKYFDNIFRNVIFYQNVIPFPIYEEPFFQYKKIPTFEDSTKLIGYFQSENYFCDFKNEIMDFFSIDNKTLEYLKQKYIHIIDNENTCSVHVRRGDYIKLQNHHPIQCIEYYKNANNYFSDNTLYVIFSDDIEWCKQNFDFLKNKIYIENNLDYQDMYLMSMCKNNILANSSFSWWGAWLNQNKNKKVVAPLKWFGQALEKNNTRDLYIKDWIII